MWVHQAMYVYVCVVEMCLNNIESANNKFNIQAHLNNARIYIPITR